MTFLMAKKNENTLPPTYLHSPSRDPGPGKRPLKKKKKRNVNDVPNDKKKTKIPTHQLTFIAQAEIQVQESVP